MPARATLLLLLFLLPALPGAAQELRVFQQGAAGYDGTLDLHLSIPADFTGNGHLAGQFSTDPARDRWIWDFEKTWGQGSVVVPSQVNRLGVGDAVGLLRFDDLFGEGPERIPRGSLIESATLSLWTDNPEAGDPANLHRVLHAWDASARWSDFGALPGPQYGEDLAAAIEQTTAATPAGASSLTLDVTASLAAWSQDPASNHGWAFVPAGAQDVLVVAGSTLAALDSVRVDLEITSPNVGELVVVLRKGEYSAVLLDRIGRAGCDAPGGSSRDDLALTLDDSAAVDVHDAGVASPVLGTFRPDASCFDRPLCSANGTAGLCAQGADGDWVLEVYDEYFGSGPQAVLVSWSLHLADGQGGVESYTSSPGLAVPPRNVGTMNSTWVHSSESPDAAFRPRLEVSFRPALRLEPERVAALAGASGASFDVEIPAGANDLAPVVVDLSSDAPGVAAPVATPVVFAPGDPTRKSVGLSAVAAGSARITATTAALHQGAAIPDGWLDVEVAAAPALVAEPTALYADVAAAPLELWLSLPAGALDAGPVAIDVTSTDPGVAYPLGAPGGGTTVVFPQGGALRQAVSIAPGGNAGSALLELRAPGLASQDVPFTASLEAPVEYDVETPPFVQLGAPAPGATADQLTIVWQTIERRRGGPGADRFTLEIRRIGDAVWQPVPLHAQQDFASATHVTHAGTATGLDFDDGYEYRVTHLRDELPLPGGTYQAPVATRPSAGSFRFTAFGNSGQGSPNARAVAAQLALQDPDFHLLLGDQVYWTGEREHYRPRIADVYGDLMADRPFFATPGNHEGVSEDAASVGEFFHGPDNGPIGATPGLDYAFDWGDAHFVSVNSGARLQDLETLVRPWLEADLAASTARWKIVFTHEPPLTLDPFGIDRQADARVRDHVLAVAVEQGVQLMLAGAVHSFQRYLPITDVLDAEPWVDWATCAQGAGTTLIYPGTGAWVRSPGQPIPAELTAPMELYAPLLGIGVFDVGPDAITATLVDAFGSTIDSVSIPDCSVPGACECVVCGDGILHASESCDDGNTLSGDGCFADCRSEARVALVGSPQGGEVHFSVDGVALVVVTQPGQSLAALGVALVAAILGDPVLSAAGVGAFPTADGFVTTGSPNVIGITDPGLALLPAVPAVSTALRVVLGLAFCLLIATLLPVTRHSSRKQTRA